MLNEGQDENNFQYYEASSTARTLFNAMYESHRDFVSNTAEKRKVRITATRNMITQGVAGAENQAANLGFVTIPSHPVNNSLPDPHDQFEEDLKEDREMSISDIAGDVQAVIMHGKESEILHVLVKNQSVYRRKTWPTGNIQVVIKDTTQLPEGEATAFLVRVENTGDRPDEAPSLKFHIQACKIHNPPTTYRMQECIGIFTKLLGIKSGEYTTPEDFIQYPLGGIEVCVAKQSEGKGGLTMIISKSRKPHVPRSK
jgi:hypothetical protein